MNTSHSVLTRAALGAATLLLAAGAGACRNGAADERASLPAVTLRPENIAVVERRPLAQGPAISGALAAKRHATLRAEVEGVVLETRVEPGERVRAGQVLARLDDSGIRDAALSARSAVRTATEGLAVARRDAERAEDLAGAGALSKRELEQARWSVTSAEGALADARSRLASAEKQQAKTVIRAPFAGVVSERPANAGDVLQVGNPVVTVVDPGSLRLEATVPVSAVSDLRTGTPVDFTVSGYEDRSFTGTVERINPSVDPATRQVRIFVAIPNERGRLVTGLFAEGRVSVEQRDAVAAPLSAIDFRAMSPAVRRVRNGTVELVPVTLGLRDEVAELVEITAGLAPGDTVLIGPAASLAAGTPVRLVRE
ncbi:MAG TPA: efflux RND transporter periplasmic adaptor subunit [Gemmatimonadales bacterium]|nr:efflux RND transporter periplasmic adaptor subunit [Gemmatimonadales bacterium]